MKKYIITLLCLFSSMIIFAQNQIVSYEYWFDSDYPGHVSIAVAPVTILNLNTTISTVGLENGLHTFHIRFKDSNDLWSSVVSQHFYKMPVTNGVDNNILSYEYWFDNDYAQKTSVAVPPQTILQVINGINVEQLSKGLHTFHIRFKDTYQLWSSVISQHFYYPGPGTGVNNYVNGFRYWINGDPETMTNVSLSGTANPRNVNQYIDLSEAEQGNHVLNLQFRDVNGLWSSVTSDSFYRSKAAYYEQENPKEFVINLNFWQRLFADPVQLGTGTYTHQEKDVSIPVINGNIEFLRHYNSLNHQIPGPTGYGWSHSYQYSLVNRQDTAWDVHYADGHKATFIPANEFGHSFPLYSGTRDSLHRNSNLSYSLYTQEKTHYHFDATGKLDSIIDLNGNTTVLYYTGAILDSIAGPGGRLIELGYIDDKITSVKDPLNRYIYYEYDEDDNLIKVINANSDTSRFVYDDAHLLLTAFNNLGDTVVHNSYDPLTSKVISQKDGHQQLTIFEYDTPEVGATSVTNPDNSEIIVLHDAYYRKTNETNELGHNRSYEYDIHSNEIKTTNELGEQIKRLYDSRANMLSDTLPGNRITDVVYNQFNSPLQIIDANGNQKNLFYNTLTNNLDSIMLADSTKVRYTYDSLGQMTQMTDGKGNITNYTYSDFGDLLSIQTAAGTKHFTYDAAGRKLSETDENGHATTYTYDLNNNVLVVTDPLGKTVESTYDANNQLLSIQDKNGSITYYSYDKKGRKVSSTDPLGKITSYTYDVRDNLISVIDPNNNVVSYSYDAANRKTSMTNALGTTQYTYDPAGNLIRVTDPDNRFTDYTYTPTNKKASMTDGLGNLTSYTYDNNDNLISMTDALNRTTVYVYDVMDRLVTVTDPAGNETSVGYDAAGNRQTVTDPNGHPVSYTFDAANRLISSVDAAGNVISYTLDNNGNITTVTKPTGTITKTYDALNRIITVVNSTGDNYAFTYDDNGNVLTMTNLTGTSEMEYDSLNRLVLYTDPNGKSVGFEYDDAGNKTSMVYPGNKTVNYTYDGANNLITVTDWLGKVYTYSYDASGRIRELLYPNEIRCSYTYDQAGRLISRIYYDADSTVMSGSYFDLNPVGNRISEQKFGQQSGVPEDLSRVYAYTADDVMLSDSIWTYTHDLSGNRIAETDGIANAGYTFTVDNLLTGRTNTNADVFSYTYNPLGHRLSVTKGTEVKRFVLDISTSLSKVLQITDENGDVIADYIYGLGLLGQIDSLDNPLYYHFDGQHNTIMLTDENAQIQDWYSYDPFGTMVTHTGTTEQSFTFLGEYGVEAEAPGLYYVRARYYDALNGRFLSKDAYEYDLNNPQTINRFVYGVSNPLINIDPTGLFSWPAARLGTKQWLKGTLNSVLGVGAVKTGIAVTAASIFIPGSQLIGPGILLSSGKLFNDASKELQAGTANWKNAVKSSDHMAYPNDFSGPFEGLYKIDIVNDISNAVGSTLSFFQIKYLLNSAPKIVQSILKSKLLLNDKMGLLFSYVIGEEGPLLNILDFKLSFDEILKSDKSFNQIENYHKKTNNKCPTY